MKEIVGTLKITVSFDVRVQDTQHYEATNLEEAAWNLREYYQEGIASVSEDLSYAEKIHFAIETSNTRVEGEVHSDG